MSVMESEPHALTDPQREVIYGVVEAKSAFEVGLAVKSDPARHLFDSDTLDAGQILVSTLDQLCDGRWREVAPVGPQSDGDQSDYQVGGSVSRRFAMVRPDKMWAVCTVTWFASDDSGGESVLESARRGRLLERQDWFVITETPLDLDADGEYEYDTVDDFPKTEAGARQAAQNFDINMIGWDGDRFW